MAEKKSQIKPAKAVTPAAEHTTPKKKSAKPAAAINTPVAQAKNVLQQEEAKATKSAPAKKKPAAATESAVEQPVQEQAAVAKAKKKPAAKTASVVIAAQDTAVLELEPAKPVSSTKASKTSAVQIDQACELAMEKLRQQNAQGQYSALVAELEWVLGSYRFDGNPVGVYQKVNAALEELVALKVQSSAKVSQKLIDQLERALKN